MDDRRDGWMAGLQWRNGTGWSILVAVIALAVVLGSYPAYAALQRGTENNDVIWGRDNDNAANTFLQPTTVAAKQHLENTDVLQGSSNGDLLIGRRGDDVIDGQSGDDILIGGVENFVAPNSDILIGGTENDINIWAPGDGSDLFMGDSGTDVQIFAPFVLQPNGQPQLFQAPSTYNRVVPHVIIDNRPQFSCQIESAPGALGYKFVARFFVNGNLAVTVRLQDVEIVLCPSGNDDQVQVAELKLGPAFIEKPLSSFSNTLLGAILQAP